VQQTVLIRLTNHFKLGDCLIITICPRKLTGIVFKGVGMQLSPRPKCTIDLLHDAQQCVQSSGLMQCNYCTTESGRVWHIWSCSCCYQVARSRRRTNHTDPKWWGHLSKRYNRRHDFFPALSGWIYEKKEEAMAAFMPLKPRSIYEAFEREPHLDLVLTPLKAVGELSRVLS